jgi:hypothetical protein
MIEPRLRRLQGRMAATIAWDTVLLVTVLAIGLACGSEGGRDDRL